MISYVFHVWEISYININKTSRHDFQIFREKPKTHFSIGFFQKMFWRYTVWRFFFVPRKHIISQRHPSSLENSNTTKKKLTHGQRESTSQCSRDTKTLGRARLWWSGWFRASNRGLPHRRHRRHRQCPQTLRASVHNTGGWQRIRQKDAGSRLWVQTCSGLTNRTATCTANAQRTGCRSKEMLSAHATENRA